MKKGLLPLFVLVFATIVSALFFKFGSLKEKSQITIENKTADKTTQQPAGPIKPALTKDSIPVMSEKEFEGSDLKIIKVLQKNEFYTRYQITYKSEGFKISGIMNIPNGEGPFPVLILNHGFIDPHFYTNGQGLKREQDFFARNGYAVLHSDYRNHALSDFDPDNDVRPRSGYVEDVLNAVSAIKKADLAFLDKKNIGMLGHSMGGGITLNVMVTKPDIAKAYVLLAPINSDYKVNFDKWVVSEWPETAQNFYHKYGTYEENPQFWESVSAKNYLDSIKSPVMLHQGTNDAEVPLEWSSELAELLKNKRKEITYYEYKGEPHVFGSAQDLVMKRTLEFFNKNLKN